MRFFSDVGLLQQNTKLNSSHFKLLDTGRRLDWSVAQTLGTWREAD